MQADAFAFFAMAGGTRKVMRAAALKEQPFAHFVKSFFLRVRLRQIEFEPFGFCRNPGGQGSHVGHLTTAIRRLGNLCGIEALQCFHAGDQA